MRLKVNSYVKIGFNLFKQWGGLKQVSEYSLVKAIQYMNVQK